MSPVSVTCRSLHHAFVRPCRGTEPPHTRRKRSLCRTSGLAAIPPPRPARGEGVESLTLCQAHPFSGEAVFQLGQYPRPDPSIWGRPGGQGASPRSDGLCYEESLGDEVSSAGAGTTRAEVAAFCHGRNCVLAMHSTPAMMSAPRMPAASAMSPPAITKAAWHVFEPIDQAVITRAVNASCVAARGRRWTMS